MPMVAQSVVPSKNKPSGSFFNSCNNDLGETHTETILSCIIAKTTIAIIITRNNANKRYELCNCRFTHTATRQSKTHASAREGQRCAMDAQTNTCDLRDETLVKSARKCIGMQLFKMKENIDKEILNIASPI